MENRERLPSPKEENRELSYRDLVKYFVAGQLAIDIAADQFVIKDNIARVFSLSPERIYVEGQFPELKIDFAPEAHEDLRRRFGGKKPEDFRSHPFWENY